MKNLKLYEKAKIWFIVTVCAIVIGTLLFSIFGMNRATGYANGYEVRVSCSVVHGDDNAEIKSVADGVFAENGVKYAKYTLEEDDITMNTAGSVSVFLFKTAVPANVKADMQAALTSHYEGNLNIGEFAVETSEVSVQTNDAFVLGAVLAGVGAIAIYCAYLMLRQRFAAAFTVALAAVAEAALNLAILAITRFPVVPATFAAVMLGAAATMMAATLYTGRAKELRKKYAEGSKFTPTEAAAALEEDNVKATIAVAACLAAIALSMTAFGPGAIRLVGLATLFTCVTVSFTLACLAPCAWILFANVGYKKANKFAYKAAPAASTEE